MIFEVIFICTTMFIWNFTVAKDTDENLKSQTVILLLNKSRGLEFGCEEFYQRA
jgi:hypothetical protein